MKKEDVIPLTLDDIIADIKAAERRDSEVPGLTAREIAETLGFGEKKTAKILKKAVRSGLLKVTKVRIKDIAGRDNFTFKYHP